MPRQAQPRLGSSPVASSMWRQALRRHELRAACSRLSPQPPVLDQPRETPRPLMPTPESPCAGSMLTRSRGRPSLARAQSLLEAQPWMMARAGAERLASILMRLAQAFRQPLAWGRLRPRWWASSGRGSLVQAKANSTRDSQQIPRPQRRLRPRAPETTDAGSPAELPCRRGKPRLVRGRSPAQAPAAVRSRARARASVLRELVLRPRPALQLELAPGLVQASNPFVHPLRLGACPCARAQTALRQQVSAYRPRALAGPRRAASADRRQARAEPE